jgi:hypothetical protein
MKMEWEPDQSPKKGEGLTATQMLLAVVAVIGLAILYNVTRLPEGHPFKECEHIFGVDQRCSAKIAARNIMMGRP